MTKKNNRGCNPHVGDISRRDFLVGAAATATGLLAGCGPTPQPDVASTDVVTPTSAPVVPTDVAPTKVAAPTDAPIPTATSKPTATSGPVVEVDRPKVIQFHPDAPSKVLRTHHAGAWDGESLVPEALREMLDASITKLTGLDSAKDAWSALFGADERVAIKVNAFRNGLIWTHVPLVMAVTDALQEAGVPAENIVIFDYWTSELETAGFPVNKDGPGVRCYGTDEQYTRDWEIGGRTLGLSDVLLSCDALINMPVLKSHMITGITFAMKNHYGTIPNPGSFHASIGQRMAELNALPPIKDRTRLIVGDVLTACVRYRNSYPYWESDWTGDSILMSFDPVAHDAVGLDILSRLRTEVGSSPDPLIGMATPCLEAAVNAGLGTDDPENMDLIEVNLG